MTGVISKDAIYLYYLIENDKIINFFPHKPVNTMCFPF